MTISTQTQVQATGVEYIVLLDGTPQWRKFVRFGKKRPFRVGGQAFVNAAQEQEAEAAKLAQKAHQ